MSALGRLDEATRDLVRLHRTELLLRLLALAAPAVFLAAVLLAGSVPVWAVVVGLLLGALTVVAPDSEAGTLATGYLLGVWFFGDQTSPWTIWTLVAALALLLFHVATAAASRTPVTGRLPSGSLHRWATRTGVVAAVTVAAYVAGRSFAALDRAGSVALTTVAAAVAVGGVLGARRWTLGRRG